MDDGKRRDAGVPLQQRRSPAGELVRQAIEFPDRIDHVVVVRVDDVRLAVGVAGQMKLHDPLVRNRANVLDRVEVVVHARHVDVVHVEQQAAVGVGRHAGEKLPLGHGRADKADVGAGVFQDQRPLEKILHDADPLDDVPQRRFVERHRQQVVSVDAGHAGPTDVVRNPAGFDRVGQSFELGQVGKIQGVGAADRQRYAVHHDRIALGDLGQDAARPALRIHEVLGDRLEPIDRRMVLQNVAEVDRPQTDAQSQIRKPKTRQAHDMPARRRGVRKKEVPGQPIIARREPRGRLNAKQDALPGKTSADA